MKSNSFLIIGLLFFFISCAKNNTTPNNNLYLITTPGSTWQYRLTDTTNGVGVDTLITVTSSADDTLIGGKSYHMYTNSLSPLNDYARVDKNNYYSLGYSLTLPLPGIIQMSNPKDLLYLKSDLNIGDSFIKLGTVYSKSDLNPQMSIIPIKTIYTIIEKNINKTVNNINYSNVIHVSSSSSSDFFAPNSSVNTGAFYYAKKIGLIESYTIFHIDYILSFDQHFRTTLISSDIK